MTRQKRINQLRERMATLSQWLENCRCEIEAMEIEAMETDCQFPYECQSDCQCQRMREKVEKYYTLHLESLDCLYLRDSIFHGFYPSISLHDSPVKALTRVICDSAKVEKIESGNLPKVLRTCTQSHSVEGYYRVETTVKQITGERENKTFVGYYAVCKW